MPKTKKGSRKSSKKQTAPPQSTSPIGEVDIPAHRRAAINLLAAHMAAAGLTAATLAEKLDADKGNIYQWMKGTKQIPLAHIGIEEPKSGNNHPDPKKMDLIKALKLSDAQADKFIEVVMISHVPKKLADIIDRYRTAYEVNARK